MNRRNFSIATTIFPALLIASGCSTTGKSIGAGGLAGGVAGAGVGAIADPGSQGENRVRNVIIGTAVGAAVGAGTGFILDRQLKDEREQSYSRGKKDAVDASQQPPGSNGASPRLLPARTEAQWIPDQVRGTNFIPGHFEYKIVEGARWDLGR